MSANTERADNFATMPMDELPFRQGFCAATMFLIGQHEDYTMAEKIVIGQRLVDAAKQAAYEEGYAHAQAVLRRKVTDLLLPALGDAEGRP